MLELHNKEKDLLVSQVRETKEEAKKRILAAKERVAEMQQHVVRLEAEVAATSSSSQDSSSQKEDLIQALRSEGEALAIKMSDVEQKAKDTRIQLLDVQDELTTQLALKEKMERKVHDLETELKSIRTKWTMAQQGEVRAEQLETSLLEIREEGEIKSAKIASLETEVKEYKSQMTSMKKDMDDLVRMKETENQSDIAKWKKEKSEWMEELNAKVQTLEQEATVREDALRKEVGELRKRWQDAVQRADGKIYVDSTHDKK
jgi:predicted  nucleic acid-binding Zn-ribbon protein